MRFVKLVPCVLVLASACAEEEVSVVSTAVLFEGARLIAGDGSGVIEDSAFIVDGGEFVSVGVSGQIPDLPGVTTVDLTGMTVMPALIDGHTHLGYADVMAATMSADNYTRDNLIDHLRRYAYYGIAATRNMGTDAEDFAFELREEPVPGAALFRLAGRGIAKPNAGPNAAYYRPSAYGVTNEDDVRRVVGELADREVDVVKIWVDDRGGTVDKLTPDLYQVVIDEAHARGLQVVAHVYYLADAKELVRAGIDGFAHGVRDQDIDDELIELLRERPEVYFIPNLPSRGATTEADLAWLDETVPAGEIDRMRAAIAARTPEAQANTEAFFGIQARNLMRLRAEGVRIGFGSDAGSSIGWTAHEEMADMVAAGMTAEEVIAAATSVSADIVGLNAMGSVSEGNRADFIVLDANPLDDISNTRRIVDVYLEGEALDRDAMRAGW